MKTEKIKIVGGERVRVEPVPGGVMATLIDQPWVWEIGRSEASVLQKIEDVINGVTPGTGYVPRTEEE